MTVKRKGIYIATLEKKENSSVEYGTRPVVVLQNDKGNLHSPTTIIAPITSQLGKHRIPPHVYLQNPVLEKESIVLLEQIQTIDQKQIVEYLGDATAGEMSKIEQAVRISLGMEGVKRYERNDDSTGDGVASCDGERQAGSEEQSR